MPRIAMLIPAVDQVGGAERQLLLLARELSGRGHQVTVIALSGSGGSAAEDLSRSGIGFLSLGMRKAWIDPRGWLRYLAWARRNCPEVLHSHLPHATWFARCVRLIVPVPVLIDTIHTTHSGSVARRLAYRLTRWLTNQVTCVSASVAESVAAARIAPPRGLAVLPNGIEILPRIPVRSAAFRSQSSPFQWLAIGRLTPVKDYPTLLRAFALLPGHPCLKIAGSGPEESALRALAIQLAIADRVHFLGFQRDIQPLLATADAFVQSSLWEGLPMSILEASAAGLPIAATCASGISEAMQPGIAGLLAPVGDVDALASAMIRIMSLPPIQRWQMGAAGRAFVTQNFSLPAIATRWEQLYAHLLAQHSHPTRWRRS